MKVDIWSDVRCPFCYIGKRKFDMGLAQFAGKDEVEVVWHSFELDPDFKTNTALNVYDYLAAIKGQSREWSVQMHNNITKTAKEVGLDYNFDKAVPANSFNAHRLIQFAKKRGQGDAAKEAMLEAYFTDGKNIDDAATLVEIGASIGLGKTATSDMLASDAFTTEVREDEAMAAEIGINGVPFFVLDNKYAVSGAQAPEVFLGALQQAWAEHTKNKPQIITSEGSADVYDVNNKEQC
jgi:predicted DsbA family dithiol-disulfide isomerase